jgi:flagellar L-ring protein FlgH
MRPMLLLLLLPACQPLSEVGRAPEFSSPDTSVEMAALYRVPLPATDARESVTARSSLWSSGQRSLLGDRRASMQGDIMTVVIEIDDSAEMSNTTGRGRTGSTSMGVPQFLGLPQALDAKNQGGLQIGAGIETNNASSFSGNGSVRRSEKLQLRVASTVVETLPNGVLRIEGRQEVRVNHELRDLIVTGFVRPTDISRRNEITYDKIAGARISYGGRGVISTVQQPRYGEQILEILAPF